MKRLIKSEFLNAVEFRDKYYECFKNPTQREFEEVLKNPISNNVIRGMLLNDGTLYIWNAELLHEIAREKFNIPNGVHIEFGDDSIVIYLAPNTDAQYFKDAFNNAIELYNYLSKSARVVYLNATMYKAIFYDEYDKIKTLDDIRNLNVEELKLVRAKLIESEIFTGIEYRNNYIEIFKNPTSQEFNEVLKSPFGNNRDMRGMLLKDGTLYIWDDEMLHRNAINKYNVPNGIHLTLASDKIIIFLIPEVDPAYLKNAFVNTSSLYNFLSDSTEIRYIETWTYGAKNYSIYRELKTIGDIKNIDLSLIKEKEEEEEEVMAKRLIRSDFYDSRDPGGDFIETFKNPSAGEVDKVRNSNSYKSLNGLITPSSEIFIWRGDLAWDQLNIGSINVNNGIQFSFFPDWVFNANSQYDFLTTYNILKTKKSNLITIGDMTRPIIITNTTDTDHTGDYSFDNWTAMDDFYNANYTEIIE